MGGRGSGRHGHRPLKPRPAPLPPATLDDLPNIEAGPAMRVLPLKWQKIVIALFLNGGNQTSAYLAGGLGNPNNRDAARVSSTRFFQDDRIRAAVKETAIRLLDLAEPEMLALVLDIARDMNKAPRDRLRAISMVWDRANPVLNRTQIEVSHTMSDAELEVQHYRALQRLQAPEVAFLNRFGTAGLERVKQLVAAEDAKRKQIEGDVIDITPDPIGTP